MNSEPIEPESLLFLTRKRIRGIPGGVTLTFVFELAMGLIQWYGLDRKHPLPGPSDPLTLVLCVSAGFIGAICVRIMGIGLLRNSGSLLMRAAAGTVGYAIALGIAFLFPVFQP